MKSVLSNLDISKIGMPETFFLNYSSCVTVLLTSQHLNITSEIPLFFVCPSEYKPNLLGQA